MNDNIVGAICATIVAVVVVTSPLACSANDNYAVTRMVQAGANPLDAKCAVKQDSMSTVCVIRANIALQGVAK